MREVHAGHPALLAATGWLGEIDICHLHYHVQLSDIVLSHSKKCNSLDFEYSKVAHAMDVRNIMEVWSTEDNGWRL